MTLRPAIRRSLRRSALALAALATLGPGVASLSGQVVPRLSVRADSIIVRGNERNPDTWIIDRSGLRVGAQVNYPQVQDAIRRLFATGEFSDVRISVGPGEGRGTFVIEVVERPTITRYAFQGLENASASRIRDTVGLARDAPLDPSRVARARALIEDMLGREGFPRVRVDTAIVPDPVLPSAYQVVFRVDEGPRLGLVEIAFRGNGAFTDAELRRAMATGQEGFFWWRSGELKRQEYLRDLSERLPDHYERHGYLDFAVLDDTVVVDSRTGKGRILIRVEEGTQYLLEEFDVTGNRRFSAAELTALYGGRMPGEGEGKPPFDRVAFEEGLRRVEELYRNAGYLRALAVPDIQKLPPEEPEGRPRVAALWLVREGNPSYVREIRIVGNTHTHDRIIRSRILVFPGDIYSQQRLVQSIQNIHNIGFFDPLPPQEAIEFNERQDGDIDLTFRVKEKNTGTLNFGLSASAVTGLAGFFGYEQPNLFGQAKSGRFRWLFGGRQQDIELSYSDPEVFGSRQSLTVSLRSSRDRFLNFSLGDRRQTGGLVEVGTPVFGLRSTRLFLGYSLFRDEVRDLDTTFVTPAARQLITQGTRSTASMRLVRDTRNNPLFPTRGGRNALSARFTGGPLGGSGEYLKVEFENQFFVPVAQIGGGLQSLPLEFTAGIAFNGGVIIGDNPFFLDRFFMGGTNVGVQLRGYEEATVTPQGHVPRNARFSQLDRVGESYFTASAMFGSKLTSALFVSAFVDAGNVWAEADHFNPTDLLMGAGVGVSLVTPFGPLGLDYAYGFDRRDVLGRPDPGWELHFKFGRVF